MDPDPDGDSIFLQILILIVITLINAFFSCAEMAMVSSNKNKIKRLADGGNKKAELVQKIMEEPTKFLSTIQVAITLAGFFSAGSAATGLSGPMGEFLLKIHIPYGDEISFFLVTIILAFFTLVFGELVPKRIALSKTEEISMFVIGPVNLLSKVASPFIKLLSFSTNLVMKLFGSKVNVQEDILSREEIKSLIDEGQVHGVLNENEREMINSIIEFDDTLAKEIMTPKVNVFAINILDPIENYVDRLMDTKYSRIPVYEDDIDNVIGILYFKDYMKEAIKVGYTNVNMRSILIKPYLVPDSKNIYELFKELQVSKNHIAVLIDEYGGFSGIVTMEDLVEEVMGDIEDEYDIYVPKIKMLDNSTYLLDGLLTIDELNEELDLGISSENYDTISGFLIDTMGAIPSDDEDRTIEIDNLVFKIISVKQKRIDKIKLYIGTVS
ncbi:hemolysin family protein [Anaerocolumna sp. AGMB13020]|uniref:hemolysin family protein n=1 Tax=Anaerocolumna sp. AGMB13020 TaxID=3081750 RepID=UPI0029545E80|nr:hemolysin family protein [Anaerocolumna sp. AGMB13020]WOO37382.1 hemolysin family protein [Anaerocolumna sp. AGMB13020]